VTVEMVTLLTVPEIAEALRVSKMTVYRLINTGEIKVIKVGKAIRIPESELNRILNSAWD
jgi:excisionase family DNA binding protein